MKISHLLTVSSLLLCASLSAQVVTVSAASNRAEQPLSAGAIASAYGSFTGVVTTSASTVPLPTTLAGVRVLVNDIAAPLYFVSAGQINFQIPSSLQAGRHPLRVTFAGGEQAGNIRLMEVAPAIFVLDAARPARGAILNQDGAVNATGAPAARGSVVVIFASGQGPLASAGPADGSPAPTDRLVRTTHTPKVFIAGVDTTVEFSGLAPGFIGLWQINARVPDRNFVSGLVPLQVFLNGVDSNEVTLFVQP